MDKKSLEEKLISIEQQFNALTNQNSLNEQEAYRLQGDHRTIKALIDNWVEPKKEVKDGK